MCFLQCINREAQTANFSSSLNLPDKTLQFVKDHPLMDESVTPVDSRPRLIKGDVNYTQIVVDRTRALDGAIHDVMFVSTGGFLGKNMSTSSQGFFGDLMVKNPPANARDTSSVPGRGRSLREGKGNPLQHSCLENPVNRGAWWATVYRVAKNQTRLEQPNNNKVQLISATRSQRLAQVPMWWEDLFVCGRISEKSPHLGGFRSL